MDVAATIIPGVPGSWVLKGADKVTDAAKGANSAIRGQNGRVFITNNKGEVILDITKDRVKTVIPGRGFKHWRRR